MVASVQRQCQICETSSKAVGKGNSEERINLSTDEHTNTADVVHVANANLLAQNALY